MYDITIKITDKCNFNCKYCIFKRDNSGIPPLDCDRVVSFLNKFSKHISKIRLTGGEPLIYFDNIKRLLNNLDNKDIEIEITTNGVLLDKNKIKFFKSLNNLKLTFSLDGEKESNDLNRVDNNGNGTYDQVVKKIRMIKKEGIFLSMTTTLDPSNYSNLFNNFLHILRFSPDEFSISPVVNVNWSKEDIAGLKSQIMKVMWLYSKYIKKKQMHFSLLGLLKNLEGITIDDATCFTSCGSHLFLDNEGNVYLCGTYSLLEEPQNEGFVMNINEDFSKFEEIVGVQRAKIKPCLSVFEKKTKDYDDSPSEIDNVSFANQVKLMGCFVSGLNMLLDMSKKDPQLRKSLFSIPHINKMRKRIKTSV